MSEPIDIEVTGCGRVRGGEVQSDTSVQARCALCQKDVDAAATIALPAVTGALPLACAPCLRARLDALSVGRFRLAPSAGIPWGKVSG